MLVVSLVRALGQRGGWDPGTGVGGADEQVADVAHHADHLLVLGVPSLARSRRTWTSMVRMPPKKS
jgi:hypothetical protein